MAASALRLEITDHLAQITFDQPGSRANTLSQAVLGDFEQVLTQLEGTADLQGLVLVSGKPGMFVAGADLKELGAAEKNSNIAQQLVQRGLAILMRLEKLPYPTLAVVDGACMGGGTELALGFDYRLAGSHPKCEIGLPETKIGLIPGLGGTQRLTRIIGPALATELICAGDSYSATKARDLGVVFDAVPSERLLAEALRILAWARSSGDWQETRRRKQLPVGLSEEQHRFAYEVARAQVLAKTKGQLPAPLAALEAVFQGCNLPLDAGLKVETEQFVPLVGSSYSKNLIAVFFMQQRLQKDPGVADPGVQPRTVERVAVIGAGIMGAGIAGAHLRRGVPTMMMDVAPAAVEKGTAAILKTLQSRVEIGRMKPDEVIKTMSLLSTSVLGSAALAALAERDVVIEAVVEKEEVKSALYQQVQPAMKAEAILASNTSTISITRMAQVVERPENFAGLHFFNPVDRMQLVEVIRGEKTSDATTATLVALAKKIGKSPIVVRDCPGFLVNRILFPYINEALVLLEEGAGPRDLDKAATDFGMPMGPITLNDLVGLDTALYAGNVVNAAYADRAASCRILEELVRAGRLGQKSGAGFFSYAKGSRGQDDPAFAAILEKCRQDRRSISQEEITERLFLAMLGEACRVVAEGIVRDPADVDLGLILGIGFPAWRGGVLRWAQTIGLDSIRQKMAKYERLGQRFQPTGLLMK